MATTPPTVAPPVGRVEREHLAGLGELRLRVGERHAGLEHGGEVALVVLDDLVRARAVEISIASGRRAVPQPSLVPAPRKRTGVPASAAALSAAPSSSRAAGAAATCIRSAPRRPPPRAGGWR